MTDFVVARALHILSVLFWIGGVAFVTTVVMPAIRRGTTPSGRMEAFRGVESGFNWQARLWVAVAGATGFWMTHRAQMWDRFLDPTFWWMHAMVGLWLVFAVMLFALEPLFLDRVMERPDPNGLYFRRLEVLHRLLLAFAVITAAGAVAGSHGLL